MFLPSHGTPYDLRFGLFGIPVTVSPFFWVMAVLLGFSWLSREPGGPANLVAWVLCVFVSIILHEFGHALTMRAFGHYPEVVLHHFGGYATYRGHETAGRSLIISAAGPAAQIVVFLAILIGACVWMGVNPGVLFESPRYLLASHYLVAEGLASAGLFESNTPVYALVDSMLFVNLIWPLFNLLPVIPLDGGRILASGLELMKVKRAEEWAQRVGVVVAILGAIFFLFQGMFLAGAMFAYMAMANYLALKGESFG